MSTPFPHPRSPRSLGATLPALTFLAVFGIFSAASSQAVHSGSPAARSAEPTDSDETTPPSGMVGTAGSGGTGGGRKVWFAPSDSAGTATVLIFFNTTASPVTVRVTGYQADGTKVPFSNIELGPNGSARAVSDPVAAGAPPSFQNTIDLNFTDFVDHVRLKLPKGVHVDGYFVYNDATGTVDPRVDQGAVPIRFSDKF